MKYFVSAVSAVVASAVVGVLAQNNISIPTPSNVVQCTNISITWQGGSPPFTLNGNANGAILQTVSDIPSNTYIWNTDIQGPTQIGMTVRDTNGLSGQSGPFAINTNSDTSCLNAAASVTASSTDSAASTPASGSVTGSAPVSSGSSAPAGSSTGSGGSSAAATSGASSASGSSPASSGSPTSSSSSAAGSQTSASSAANVAATGFAGLFSVLLAAFLA